MAESNKKFQYTVAKVLHWVAAFIIAFNLLSAWKLEDFPLAQKEILIMIHSGLGVTIFLLMLFRWWWRRSRNLYAPPKWYKRPSMLIQWVFYPLLLLQPVIGVAQAAYIDYPVLAFGFIDLSALAENEAGMHSLFHQLHEWTAIVLIALVLIHGLERYRKVFSDDGSN